MQKEFLNLNSISMNKYQNSFNKIKRLSEKLAQIEKKTTPSLLKPTRHFFYEKLKKLEQMHMHEMKKFNNVHKKLKEIAATSNTYDQNEKKVFKNVQKRLFKQYWKSSNLSSNYIRQYEEILKHIMNSKIKSKTQQNKLNNLSMELQNYKNSYFRFKKIDQIVSNLHKINIKKISYNLKNLHKQKNIISKEIQKYKNYEHKVHTFNLTKEQMINTQNTLIEERREIEDEYKRRFPNEAGFESLQLLVLTQSVNRQNFFAFLGSIFAPIILSTIMLYVASNPGTGVLGWIFTRFGVSPATLAAIQPYFELGKYSPRTIIVKTPAVIRSWIFFTMEVIRSNPIDVPELIQNTCDTLVSIATTYGGGRTIWRILVPLEKFLMTVVTFFFKNTRLFFIYIGLLTKTKEETALEVKTAKIKYDYVLGSFIYKKLLENIQEFNNLSFSDYSKSNFTFTKDIQPKYFTKKYMNRLNKNESSTKSYIELIIFLDNNLPEKNQNLNNTNYNSKIRNLIQQNLNINRKIKESDPASSNTIIFSGY